LGARLGQPRGRRALQDGVLRHGDHVLDPGDLQFVEDRRCGEAAIHPDAHAGAGKRRPQFGNQAPQDPLHAQAGRRVAGPQGGRDQVLAGLVIEREEHDQWEITPAAVEPVEEAQLLRAMGRIFGDVHVDGDATRPALAPSMARDHAVGQRVAQSVQLPGAQRILEPRNRRLRGQAPAVDGIAIQQQLVDRVVGEAIGVIAVRIPAGDPKDPLREDVAPGLPHMPGRSRVVQHLGQRRRQAERAVRRMAPPSELACA
jgi:hypothetical protein